MLRGNDITGKLTIFVGIAGLVLFAFLFGVVKTPASGDQPMTLVILEFENNSGDPKLEPFRKGLRDMLTTDLSCISEIYIVERERLSDILGELELAEGKYIDPKTAAKVGKGVGAKYILTGSYTLSRNRVRIDVRLVSVGTGTILFAEQIIGSLNEFFDLEKEIAETIARKLQDKIERKNLWRLRQFHTQDLKAFMSYSKAAMARDEGRLDEAKEALRLALAKDPHFGLAEKSLAALESKVAMTLKGVRAQQMKERGKIADILEEHRRHHGQILEHAKYDAEYFEALIILSAHAGLIGNHELEKKLLIRFWQEIVAYVPPEDLLAFMNTLRREVWEEGDFFERHVDSCVYEKADKKFRLAKDTKNKERYLISDNRQFLKPALRTNYYWPRYSMIWPFNVDARQKRPAQVSQFLQRELEYQLPRYPHDYLKKMLAEIKQDEQHPNKYLTPRFPETLEFSFYIAKYYAALPHIPEVISKELEEIHSFIITILMRNLPEFYTPHFCMKAIPVLRILANVGNNAEQRNKANMILLKFVRYVRIMEDDTGSSEATHNKPVKFFGITLDGPQIVFLRQVDIRGTFWKEMVDKELINALRDMWPGMRTNLRHFGLRDHREYEKWGEVFKKARQLDSKRYRNIVRFISEIDSSKQPVDNRWSDAIGELLLTEPADQNNDTGHPVFNRGFFQRVKNKSSKKSLQINYVHRGKFDGSLNNVLKVWPFMEKGDIVIICSYKANCSAELLFRVRDYVKKWIRIHLVTTKGGIWKERNDIKHISMLVASTGGAARELIVDRSLKSVICEPWHFLKSKRDD